MICPKCRYRTLVTDVASDPDGGRTIRVVTCGCKREALTLELRLTKPKSLILARALLIKWRRDGVPVRLG